MTYQELIAEIADLMAASDEQGIIDLITVENVETIVRCTGAMQNPSFQPTDQLDRQLEKYQDLLTQMGVEIIKTLADVLSLFTLENALYARIGDEYLATSEIADYHLRVLGYIGVSTQVDTEYERITDEQNQTTYDPC